MGLENTIEKLDKYFRRLDQGKAQKIKPSHVEKVILKLEKKADLLRSEIDESEKESKKHRLERKLELVRQQLTRANWLAEQIGAPA